VYTLVARGYLLHVRVCVRVCVLVARRGRDSERKAKLWRLYTPKLIILSKKLGLVVVCCIIYVSFSLQKRPNSFICRCAIYIFPPHDPYFTTVQRFCLYTHKRVRAERRQQWFLVDLRGTHTTKVFLRVWFLTQKKTITTIIIISSLFLGLHILPPILFPETPSRRLHHHHASLFSSSLF